METPVLESFFNKVVPAHLFYCEFYKTFMNTYFREHLSMAASDSCLQQC